MKRYIPWLLLAYSVIATLLCAAHFSAYFYLPREGDTSAFILGSQLWLGIAVVCTITGTYIESLTRRVKELEDRLASASQ